MGFAKQKRQRGAGVMTRRRNSIQRLLYTRSNSSSSKNWAGISFWLARHLPKIDDKRRSLPASRLVITG